MKYILLTNSEETVKVDDWWYDTLSKHEWRLCNGYVVTGQTYRGDYKFMHKIICPVGSKNEVDHKDKDRLNNQESNLREATHTQNQANRKLNKNNKSGYKGVEWTESNRKWRGRIIVNQAKIHLGYFENVVDAARAYNEAALKHFGEFARLNKIP